MGHIWPAGRDLSTPGIEVLESIYAAYISRLENKVQNLPLEAADKVDEIENSDSDHIEFPISRTNENSTYDAISFQTFGEFYLDKADWNAISYLDKDDINHIKIGWTNVIADKFSEINSICVLKFKHFWFKKKDSRKLNSPFFQAWAVCKFSNCCSVTFSINNDFASFGDDLIAVHYTSNGELSSEHKDDKTIHARHITAKKRENMGAKLTQNSVSNTFHQQFRN